ncbi:MAG: hypothetical protein M3Y59_13895 [Myxococcota bacterium]|nr:hypothetical protein [Myxococcota bacterium]
MKRLLLSLALLASAGCIELEDAEREFCLREGNEGICPTSPMAYGLQLMGTPEQCGELSVAVTTSELGVPALRTSLQWATCPAEDSPPTACGALATGTGVVIPREVVGVLRVDLVAEYEGHTRTFRAFSAPVTAARNGAALDTEWVTGFETGTLQASQFINQYQAQVVPVTGGHALQLVSTGTGAFGVRSYVELNPDRLVVRASMTLSSLSGSANLLSVSTSNAVIAAFGVDGDGNFALRLPGSAPTGGVPAITGRTYQLDLIFSFAGGHRIKGWVDGVALPGAEDLAGPADQVQVLTLGSGLASNFQVQFDDVVTSLTSPDPLGAGYVIALRPDSAGPHAGPELFGTRTDPVTVLPLSGSDTTSWNLLDEVPLADADGAILQQVNNPAAYVTHGFQDFFVAPPDAVSLTYAVGTTDVAGNTWSKAQAVLEGVIEEIYYSGQLIPQGWRGFSGTIPPPGVASREWNLCHLNKLQSRWGFSEDVSGSQPVLHGMVVEAFIAGPRP